MWQCFLQKKTVVELRSSFSIEVMGPMGVADLDFFFERPWELKTSDSMIVQGRIWLSSKISRKKNPSRIYINFQKNRRYR